MAYKAKRQYCGLLLQRDINLQTAARCDDIRLRRSREHVPPVRLRLHILVVANFVQTRLAVQNDASSINSRMIKLVKLA